MDSRRAPPHTGASPGSRPGALGSTHCDRDRPCGSLTTPLLRCYAGRVMDLEKRKLGLMLSSEPAHDNLDAALGLSDAALARGVDVSLDPAAPAARDPALGPRLVAPGRRGGPRRGSPPRAGARRARSQALRLRLRLPETPPAA